MLFGNYEAIANVNKEERNDEQSYEIEGPRVINVILQRYYLDGEMSEQAIKETVLSMQDFWAKYEGWQLVELDKDKIVFRREVDDISPLLKANGYFGITEDGILTIFKGKPDSEEVIQSFFQIDVERLESRQHQQLQNGIRIKTKDQYKKVIETFKMYSIPEST